MNRKIFVNLPISDLKRSTEFFTKVGFTFDLKFTDEKATCMVISDTIYCMLVTEPFFKTFTKKEIADATKTTEVILALSCSTRDEVDSFVNRAKEAGGIIPSEAIDHGFMYQHGFQDPDNHLWEVFWMDPEALK